MGREVSESCVESLMTEIVSSYCNHLYANKPELAARRIEAIGYQVGHQLSERIGDALVSFCGCENFRKKRSFQILNLKLSIEFLEILIPISYTMDRPRFSDHLEAIKFICKDFWTELFKKQIDNLKTNHRGTFVLQDNQFNWLSHMSIEPSSQNSGSVQDPSTMAESKAAQATGMYLYFPCGIIRGALSNLGIPCAVSADISNLPAFEALITLISVSSEIKLWDIIFCLPGTKFIFLCEARTGTGMWNARCSIMWFICDPDKGLMSGINRGIQASVQ
ncbi:hypothetical protein TEA_020915 [Camellia sinensis var. sinensis]|uniref:Trafficking protein particle complex subunit 6B n=1 Tax=Camellia sinensis var. sinensis TaxID=542762 RepID=A0A4S4EHV0_CAMSN|nr:hypothetical protein TEA_020915 [Camellia sinensis var. sinensis]